MELTHVLDLFCGSGGATLGYLKHPNVTVTGIDIQSQPYYPSKFMQADALQYLLEHFEQYDFIHASPPCTEYSVAKGVKIAPKDNTLSEVLTFLRASGKPYVVENVPFAARFMHNPVYLSGAMFGLSVYKKRVFECSFATTQLKEPPKYERLPLTPLCECYWDKKDRSKGSVSCGEYAAASGLPLWSRKALRNALPPVYTQYLFKEYLYSLKW